MGIPCLFHKITGFYCPGCGVTRMFRSLASGNITAAFIYNPYVFAVLPVVFVIIARCFVRYCRGGRMTATRAEERIVIGIVFGLVAFGVIRNLPVYPWHIY